MEMGLAGAVLGWLFLCVGGEGGVEFREDGLTQDGWDALERLNREE